MATEGAHVGPVSGGVAAQPHPETNGVAAVATPPSSLPTPPPPFQSSPLPHESGAASSTTTGEATGTAQSDGNIMEIVVDYLSSIPPAALTTCQAGFDSMCTLAVDGAQLALTSVVWIMQANSLTAYSARRRADAEALAARLEAAAVAKEKSPEEKRLVYYLRKDAPNLCNLNKTTKDKLIKFCGIKPPSPSNANLFFLKATIDVVGHTLSFLSLRDLDVFSTQLCKTLCESRRPPAATYAAHIKFVKNNFIREDVHSPSVKILLKNADR